MQVAQGLGMTTNSSTSRLFLSTAALLLASVGFMACSGTVTSGDPNGQSSDPSKTCDADCELEPSTAIAMLYSELPDYSGSGVGTTAAAGGDPIDPNTLFVFIGEQPQLCEDPHAAMSCGDHWRVTVALPPAFQQPGMYDLAQLNGFFTVTGPGAGDDCWWGGGTFEGWIEIVSIDEGAVTGSLFNTPTYDFDANGDFVASRCDF
jgi:hypothetical protein